MFKIFLKPVGAYQDAQQIFTPFVISSRRTITSIAPLPTLPFTMWDKNNLNTASKWNECSNEYFQQSVNIITFMQQLIIFHRDLNLYVLYKYIKNWRTRISADMNIQVSRYEYMKFVTWIILTLSLVSILIKIKILRTGIPHLKTTNKDRSREMKTLKSFENFEMRILLERIGN
jgi:hypothetical protein